MGAKHSHHHHEQQAKQSVTTEGAQDLKERQPSAEVIEYAPPLTPTLLGFASGAEDKFRILPQHALAALHAAVPPAPTGSGAKHHDSWFLLYNSRIHGASFNRMVSLIVDRGPTLIVIHDSSSGRIFGGYNEASWTTVAQREKDAKSAAAGNARAKRNGMADQITEGRASNQAGIFFGNERSFVFRCDDPAGGSNVPVVYHARAHVNSNFMYLFDAHPDEDKVGIGMGGVPPAHFGWFMNRWLEDGVCRGSRCTTFHNPMLSATESWAVGGVEVYALGADVVEELKTREVFADGKTATDTGDSIRKGRVVDKIILELHGTHHFYGDEARCQDDEEGAEGAADGNRCLS